MADTESNNLQIFIKDILKVLGNNKPSNNQIKLARVLFSSLLVGHKIIFQPKLTQKEIVHLMLVAKGLKADEIAALLNLKKPTVQTHQKRIKQKLACATMAQAVYEGMQYGELIHKNLFSNLTQIPKFYERILPEKGTI